MKNIIPAILFILLFGSLATAAEIQVFAASSLTDALKAIAAGYERRTGDKLLYNFSASNILAIQIEEGAPADVFFSADEKKMDALQSNALIVDETRKALLSNSLVIVTPLDSRLLINSPARLADPNLRVAIAQPETVPAGLYAKEYLSKAGIWNKMIDRIVPTESVRAALAAVESGNVDAGIVYRTDAAISKRVKIVYEIPPKDGPKISYPVAAIRGSKNLEAAKRFIAYLASPDALQIFRKYGFLIAR
jgi:molybdate transport system substrate-binding protein